MKTATIIAMLAAAVLLAAPAMGDWNPGDPAKWVQRPDLTDHGMDVHVSATEFQGNMVADDYECTDPGPVTNVHLWGSWKNDQLPGLLNGTPTAVQFRLLFFSDVPAADSPTGYSMPGDLLWSGLFTSTGGIGAAGSFTAREYATGLNEGWYDPRFGQYDPNGDTICWQYNFRLGAGMFPTEPFVQEGTPDNPMTYWLGVVAFPFEDMTGGQLSGLFGWKTSIDHWNDDATYGYVLSGQYPEDWVELHHPTGGESLDMAFVIVPEPVSVGLLGLGTLVLLRRRRCGVAAAARGAEGHS